MSIQSFRTMVNLLVALALAVAVTATMAEDSATFDDKVVLLQTSETSQDSSQASAAARNEKEASNDQMKAEADEAEASETASRAAVEKAHTSEVFAKEHEKLQLDSQRKITSLSNALDKSRASCRTSLARAQVNAANAMQAIETAEKHASGLSAQIEELKMERAANENKISQLTANAHKASEHASSDAQNKVKELLQKLQGLHQRDTHSAKEKQVNEISEKLNTEFTLRQAEKRRSFELTEKLISAGKRTPTYHQVSSDEQDKVKELTEKLRELNSAKGIKVSPDKDLQFTNNVALVVQGQVDARMTAENSTKESHAKVSQLQSKVDNDKKQNDGLAKQLAQVKEELSSQHNVSRVVSETVDREVEINVKLKNEVQELKLKLSMSRANCRHAPAPSPLPPAPAPAPRPPAPPPAPLPPAPQPVPAPLPPAPAPAPLPPAPAPAPLPPAPQPVPAPAPLPPALPPAPPAAMPLGSTVALRGGHSNFEKYCADEGDQGVKCNRMAVGGWEKFRVVDAGDGKIALQGGSSNFRNYCGDAVDQIVKCNRAGTQDGEKFLVLDAGDGKIALKGGHGGFYCTDEGDDGVKCSRSNVGSSEKFEVRCMSGCNL